MRQDIIDKVNIMATTAENWLVTHNYHFIECNYVPERLFTKNRKINLALRTFFRLCPYNIRSQKDIDKAPFAPHAAVAMLKAFSLKGDDAKCSLITNRIIERLRSPRTENFSLRQGIKIALNLYEDSADDPTPLNTVWFGEYLLENYSGDDNTWRDATILSICKYLVKELGYCDYHEKGIYFYYGHHMKDIIYNASAIISAFLIKCGHKYNNENLISLGHRGIEYIINCQNDDGSWFYYGPPLKKAIDGFHQAYILKALIDAAKTDYSLNIEKNIQNGIKFYRSQFRRKGGVICPQRYDKRFNPRNTWLAQKIDGRDASEAMVFFSLYEKDEAMVSDIVNFMYYKLYDRKRRRFASDIFIYGRNRNDYIEFYSWYLYALCCIKKVFDI